MFAWLKRRRGYWLCRIFGHRWVRRLTPCRDASGLLPVQHHWRWHCFRCGWTEPLPPGLYSCFEYDWRISPVTETRYDGNGKVKSCLLG